MIIILRSFSWLRRRKMDVSFIICLMLWFEAIPGKKVRFRETEHSALDNSSKIHSATNISSTGCVYLCAKEDECLAFSYNMTTRKCQLSSHKPIAVSYISNVSVRVKNIWRQESIDNYLRKMNLPAVSELTACFYYEPIAPMGLQDLTGRWLLSFASQDGGRDLNNGFLLGFQGSKFQLHNCDSSSLGTVSESLKAFADAHRHCFTYTASTLEWFYDKTTPGVLEKHISSSHHCRCVILDGASLVPLNDQDSVGGELDSNQMIGGLLGDLQVWNRSMTDQEIKSLACGAEGNLVKFKEMEIVGEGEFEAGDVGVCKEGFY